VTLEANPNEAREARWVSQQDLKAMLADKSLLFTPWFSLICQSMLYQWWDHLDQGLEGYENETQIRRMIDPPKD
jgi:isopentenyl-diphosphate delta-isomerase